MVSRERLRMSKCTSNVWIQGINEELIVQLLSNVVISFLEYKKSLLQVSSLITSTRE